MILEVYIVFGIREKGYIMATEIMINREYKSIYSYLNRVKKELNRAGCDDILDTYMDNSNITIKEHLRQYNDYSENYKDKDGCWAIDFRPLDGFIYIYTFWH